MHLYLKYYFKNSEEGKNEIKGCSQWQKPLKAICTDNMVEISTFEAEDRSLCLSSPWSIE